MFNPKRINIGKEKYGIVLDFLQHGYATDIHRRPVAQIIGVDHLQLLEVIPKKGVFLQPFEQVYIGDQKREKIHHISRKITYNDLTETAKLNLEEVIKESIQKQPEKIVEFFNKACPISTRLHQLELIPGIGKKHMWAILEEREKAPFKDIEDLKARVPLLPSPIKSIIRRVLDEIEGVDKYKIILPRINLRNMLDLKDHEKNN